MSDSELSEPANVPGDDEIEQCLRRVVREHKKKDEDPPSVNQIRDIAANELGFDVALLKGSEWKTRSKDIIHDAFNEEDEPAPEKPKPKPKKAAPKPKAKGTKRKSDEDEPQKPKRRKKARKDESDDEASEPEDEEEEESDAKPAKKPAKKRATKKTAKKVESEVEDEDDDEKPEEPAEEPEKEAEEEPAEAAKEDSELSDVPDKLEAPEANGKSEPAPEDDDSDMSSLIDEPPKKKRGKKAASENKPKAKAKAAPKAKGKPAGKELSPDEEKIKSLQGWLVKCGIRKVWGKELAKCDTPKEKIKHLTKMLEDAGMTPRYSNEKAKQIKEARELKAELEAAQEFNERWGQSEGEDSAKEEEEDQKGSDTEEKKDAGPPKRRLPKGFVDFGDSGDEGSD